MTTAPDHGRSSLTVHEVLMMSSVQNGRPQILAGESGLDAPVRWVHIAAGSGVASLLTGGELILTTGAGWPREEKPLLDEVTDLLQANIAGLCLELGARFSSVPQVLVELCESRSVALIALTEETRFVQITEQVHRAILDEQAEALRARDEVQTMLTKLGLNGAPVDYVVEQLATELRCPVVLENTAGEVMSWFDPAATSQPGQILKLWPRHPQDPFPDGYDAVRVEARNARWGQLIALPGAGHPAGRHTVLELGSVALALGRLADPLDRSDRWLNTNAKRLFSVLLEGKYRNDADIQAQFVAAGIPFAERALFAFSIRQSQSARGKVEGEIGMQQTTLTALEQVLGDEVHAVCSTAYGPEDALLGVVSLPASVPGSAERAPLAQLEHLLGEQLDARLQEALNRPAQHPVQLMVTIGPMARSVSELVTSLEMVSAVKPFTPTQAGALVSVEVLAKQPLSFLVNELRTDARLERFAREVLTPLLEYDRRHRSDLTRVLEAYVRHPTNRSEAAKAANLSRSVFYQRLELIQDLLDADLADGTTIATLYLALQTVETA